MRLLRDNLIVERVKRPTQFGSMILLPGILQDDANTGGPKEFHVLAVGPGRRNKAGNLVPLECQPGDRIICQSWTTGPVEFAPGQFIIDSACIMAVIPQCGIPHCS